MRYYDYPSKEREDVFVELADLDKVKYGEVFKGRILLEVSTKFFTRVPGSKSLLYLLFQDMIYRVYFRIVQTKYEH